MTARVTTGSPVGGPSIYLPKPFEEHDLALLHEIIEAYSFGMLVAPASAGPPMIGHLPFLLHRAEGPQGTLLLHVARANPLRALLEEGAPVLAVFRGPHGYVSPGWYTSRDEVPTWNYAVVHAHASPRPLDEAELVASLASLAAIHERGQPDPWTLADLGAETRGRLLPAIAGFALTITALEGKLKLSQNRKPEDREGALRGIAARGAPDDAALAALMRRRGPEPPIVDR
jgi:transcriptional regulator